jgi:branched-chain amino acid transport system substrate-binding protein
MIAPDYAAGRDMMTGFKRYYKGRVAAEIYTKFGQSDYQVEISQIRDTKPKAVFVFLPGGMGIQFVKQYAQAGMREKIPLYSAFTIDETTLPAIGEAAAGNYEVGFWSPYLDNPRNNEFVTAFRKQYGYDPSFYAAQSFDAITMVDRAVAAVGGDVGNKPGMIAALEKADFPTVRGEFKYNKNHFPIQDFYLLRIARDKSGNYARMIEKKVFDDHADSYADQCKMTALR